MSTLPRRQDVTPIADLLNRMPGNNLRPARRLRDDLFRLVRDERLSPHVIEPSIALGEQAARWIVNASLERCRLLSPLLAAFDLETPPWPALARSFAERGGEVFLGIAVDDTGHRRKLYFRSRQRASLEPVCAALRVGRQHLERASMLGVDLDDRGDIAIKSYVPTTADAVRTLDGTSELLDLLSARGVALESLRIHRAARSRRDGAPEVAIHVQVETIDDRALGSHYASVSGARREAALLAEIASEAQVRVLSETIDRPSGRHVYLALPSPRDCLD